MKLFPKRNIYMTSVVQSVVQSTAQSIVHHTTRLAKIFHQQVTVYLPGLNEVSSDVKDYRFSILYLFLDDQFPISVYHYDSTSCTQMNKY